MSVSNAYNSLLNEFNLTRETINKSPKKERIVQELITYLYLAEKENRIDTMAKIVRSLGVKISNEKFRDTARDLINKTLSSKKEHGDYGTKLAYDVIPRLRSIPLVKNNIGSSRKKRFLYGFKLFINMGEGEYKLSNSPRIIKLSEENHYDDIVDMVIFSEERLSRRQITKIASDRILDMGVNENVSFSGYSNIDNEIIAFTFDRLLRLY